MGWPRHRHCRRLLALLLFALAAAPPGREPGAPSPGDAHLQHSLGAHRHLWWITNLSDRYFVTYMVGLMSTVLMASIPMTITLVSAIFIQAWQISAFEKDKQQSARFFHGLSLLLHLGVFAASGILLHQAHHPDLCPKTLCPGAMSPFDLAVSFSCLVTFLGTVYNTAKRT